MQQSIILIRGLPGAGKSTIARGMLYSVAHSEMFEADQFMVSHDGQYEFKHSRLIECHRACFNATKNWVQQGKTAIVSNTFMSIWEMQPYLNLADELRIPLQVIDVQSSFKSEHNVPEEKIELMRNRYQRFELARFDRVGRTIPLTAF